MLFIVDSLACFVCSLVDVLCMLSVCIASLFGAFLIHALVVYHKGEKRKFRKFLNS